MTRRRLTWLTAAAVVLGLFVLRRPLMTSPASDAWQVAGVSRVTAATPAPRLSLTTLDGRRVATFVEGPRLTLLYFWATW